jgi:hypothetical protein
MPLFPSEVGAPSPAEDLADLVALRRDLHAHPEIAYQETRTAGIVASALSLLGLEIHEGIAGTGVVGTLRAGYGGRAIGLRADMDALPMVELGQQAHASRHRGAHHGCGHDGHTAMLLGAARELARARDFDGGASDAESPRERALSEAAAFALRIDVAEELARLASHLDEIQRLLSQGGEIGKRLDFLIQELHREANTLGSKSATLELTNIAVDMKVLIEQLREQVQNIE